MDSDYDMSPGACAKRIMTKGVIDAIIANRNTVSKAVLAYTKLYQIPARHNLQIIAECNKILARYTGE